MKPFMKIEEIEVKTEQLGAMVSAIGLLYADDSLIQPSREVLFNCFQFVSNSLGDIQNELNQVVKELTNEEG